MVDLSNSYVNVYQRVDGQDMPRETILWFFVVPCGPVRLSLTHLQPQSLSAFWQQWGKQWLPSSIHRWWVPANGTKAPRGGKKGPFELFMADQMIDLSWFLIRYWELTYVWKIYDHVVFSQYFARERNSLRVLLHNSSRKQTFECRNKVNTNK